VSDVRAMILSAGLGTRMRPQTLAKPKPLVEVGGRPLIDFALATLLAADIRDVVINLHHLGDQIRDYLGDGHARGLRIEYSFEEVLQGSGGGIRDARWLLGTGTFVTLNADTLIGIELGPFLEEHRSRAAAATLILRKDPDMDRFGTIGIAPNGRIHRFLDHMAPSACDRGEPYMFTGVQILEQRAFDYMDGSGPFSITEVTYPRMLAAGEPLFGSVFSGPWLTVGTPEELAAAEASLRRRALDWPPWMGLS
jgi:NDP-sugar pyrophosphorylase family protein